MSSLSTATATPDTPSKLRSVAVLAALLAVIAGLHFVARFGLSGPAQMTLDSIREWANEPVAAIATAARWTSLLLTYYLAVVVGVTVIFGDQLEDSRFERFAPSSVTGLVGILLGTSAIVVPMAMHETPVLEQQQQPQPAATSPLTLNRLDDPLSLSRTPDSSDLSLVWSDTRSSNGDDAWIVESGDSLWTIAQETLEDHSSGVSFSEEEIADYWRTLIAANEDRLVEPGNPDFILPGQELILPPTT